MDWQNSQTQRYWRNKGIAELEFFVASVSRENDSAAGPKFQESQVSRLQCRSVAQTDFVPVAAARGRGRVAGDCLRYGNWLVGVTMMCMHALLVGGLVASHGKSVAQVNMCLFAQI